MAGLTRSARLGPLADEMNPTAVSARFAKVENGPGAFVDTGWGKVSFNPIKQTGFCPASRHLLLTANRGNR
jgi:hypothetical protein